MKIRNQLSILRNETITLKPEVANYDLSMKNGFWIVLKQKKEGKGERRKKKKKEATVAVVAARDHIWYVKIFYYLALLQEKFATCAL